MKYVAVIVGLWLVVDAGCGSVKPPDDAEPSVETPARVHVSGSRIKARWYTADGFKLLQTWFDSQLQTPCSWVDTSDGKRCLPTSATGSISTFLDPGCTQPVLLFTPSTCQPAPPAYVGRSTTTTCGSLIAAVHTVADRIAATQVYTSTIPGQCTSTPVAAGSEVYAVGSAPLSMFVGATPGMETGSGRFAHTYLTGDDGTRVVTGIRDTLLDNSCTLVAAGTQVRCVPPTLASISLYGDASCESGLIGKDISACASPTSPVAIFDTTSCRHRVFERGADFLGEEGYFPSNGTCTRTAAPGFPLQRLGPEVVVPELSAARPSTRLATGEATLEGFTGNYGAVRDTMLDFECFPLFLRTADGVRRCLPPPFQQAQQVYSNATCTTAINVAIVQSSPCPTPIPRFVNTREPATGCTEAGPPLLFRLFPVTTEITTQLYSKGATCEPLVLSSLRAYALGPEQPASSFQAVEVTTDP